jgi:hypothetical protein
MRWHSTMAITQIGQCNVPSDCCSGGLATAAIFPVAAVRKNAVCDVPTSCGFALPPARAPRTGAKKCRKVQKSAVLLHTLLFQLQRTFAGILNLGHLWSRLVILSSARHQAKAFYLRYLCCLCEFSLFPCSGCWEAGTEGRSPQNFKFR